MRLNTQTCKMWFCFAAPLPLGMSPHVALQDLFESHENFAKQSLIHDDFCGALLCCIFGHGSLRWTVLWRKLDRTRHRSFCFRVLPQSGLWTKEYYEIVLYKWSDLIQAYSSSFSSPSLLYPFHYCPNLSSSVSPTLHEPSVFGVQHVHL